ncbi:MAG: tRNA pseudouridine(13) synthase TruD [Nanoarchaeota archaeon]|nr:tRNA pseudouridine(13) synthase TruD [Nanoarchaeota archaeon]
MYKIKQIPEDFIVKEISNVIIKDSGNYSYYLLKKKNRNTLDVVKELAKQLGIKEKQIGFAGSKDKHALTEQLISLLNVSKDKMNKIKVEHVELEFLGYGNNPISLGDLSGNIFKITVRNLDQININKTNFVENYFDEQRFSENNKEIGKHLVKKEFSEAVKLIDNNRVQEQLKKHPNDSIGALRILPLRLLRMYVNAYQSYLWNETLAIYLKDKENTTEINYSQGLFYFTNKKEDLKIPLIGFIEPETNPKIKAIIIKLIKKENIDYKDFIIKQIPELSLEGEERQAFVEIKDLEIGKLEQDELNHYKHKIKIKFSLSKGSYATMVIRKLLL